MYVYNRRYYAPWTSDMQEQNEKMCGELLFMRPEQIFSRKSANKPLAANSEGRPRFARRAVVNRACVAVSAFGFHP